MRGDRVASSARLDKGGVIDRGTTLEFSFDGRALAGLPGDTLASAQLAAGQCLVGLSFKYHRPRGVVTAGAEEPNALVELRSGAGRQPNRRETTIELFQGLEAGSQNRFPSPRFDLGAIDSRRGRSSPPASANRPSCGRRCHRGVVATTAAAYTNPHSALHASCAAVHEASARLLRRAQAEGRARADINGDDLFALMSGLGWLVDLPSFAPRADHLFHMIAGAILTHPPGIDLETASR